VPLNAPHVQQVPSHQTLDQPHANHVQQASTVQQVLRFVSIAKQENSAQVVQLSAQIALLQPSANQVHQLASPVRVAPTIISLE
jgi:hypothetical protein